jgi:RNA polymerase sigma factor (sigma-70 family)
MEAASWNTTQLQSHLRRLRAGEASARDDLLKLTWSRLEESVGRMIKKFPKVRRWADRDDVFQGTALRLLRALESVDVTNTREFLNLAGALIRRELIDLARQFASPRGMMAHHGSVSPEESAIVGLLEPPAPEPEIVELDRWAHFHETIEALPTEEREVFSLTFYHGWTQGEIADLFGVNERTVRRKWQSACMLLNDRLGGESVVP